MAENTTEAAERCKLPKPELAGELGKLLAARRSCRAYKREELTMPQFSALLWSAMGAAGKGTRRVVPSAGATYPLDVMAVVNEPGVQNLDPGVYGYYPEGHRVELRKPGRFARELADACYEQSFMEPAPVSIVVITEPRRVMSRYGDRGRRYLYMEAGHVGQNVSLMAENLGLGTVMVGAFNDGDVGALLGLPEGYEALYILPVGVPA
jgi:SagB-type dehydrogenase family enzyme